MAAFYDYYADGSMHFVTFPNGARTEYTYDAAGRVMVIDHQDGSGGSLLNLAYDYNGRDLPTRVTEVDSLGAVTTTSFTYDNRGRLTGEIRSGTAPYNLAYEYDKGGNRTRKVDDLNKIEVLYEYDIDDVAYGTANNRLGLYITCDMSVAGAVCDRNALTPAVVSYTVYHYNDVGNVTRVMVFKWNPLPNERQVTATRFVYARNGSTVSYVIGEAWDEVAANICQDNYDIRYAREFRYDGARQRYLVRELRTSSLEFGTVRDTSPPSLIWSDYDGDFTYGDFSVDGATLTQTAIYEPGIARSFSPSDGFATQYYHANALGTTRMFTNTTSPPSVLNESSYTAFGEQVGGAAQRFGYAGAFGYQTATSDTPGDAYATDFKFMHVGARYYDPATGRFLQRDPIGIRGGLNVYAYVGSTPTMSVDPDGLVDWEKAAGLLGGWLVLVGKKVAAKVVGAACLGYATGEFLNDQFDLPNKIAPLLLPDPNPRPILRYICFVAGTAVVSKDGNRSIEQIVADDLVFTTDRSSGASTMGRVLGAGLTGYVTELIEVHISGEAFRSTVTHPYWTMNRRWIRADELTTTDVLMDMAGEPVPITNVLKIHLEHPVPVYDLSLEDFHWFYIGKTGILVHNS